jgi:hypothetical protein
MEKVYVYKDSYGEYRVQPGVVVLSGNEKLRVFNTTALKITVKVPAGASKPNDPVEVDIAAEGHDDITARSQGNGKTRAYGYKVSTSTGKKAHGNSDPVLIIEN